MLGHQTGSGPCLNEQQLVLARQDINFAKARNIKEMT
ncbi:hypothetical protein SLEP1_g58279 [Rubroshorea leprosula]|uniref:Uncharacterized protein n=1 Tax=Rubroshorea leprosula TaxID=152421 RepID=A0AAV5MQC0_9ROSI|nr:hypothetical protein SLEP1_g58279 [Rubroshorea leprosula]